jgi:hypothetical protein
MPNFIPQFKLTTKYNASIPDHKLNTQMQDFISGYKTSYPGTKLHTRYKTLIPEPKLITQVQYFIPGYKTSYPGTKIHTRYKTLIPEPKLITQVQYFIPGYKTSYPGTKIHTRVQNFIPGYKTSCSGMPVRDRPQVSAKWQPPNRSQSSVGLPLTTCFCPFHSIVLLMWGAPSLNCQAITLGFHIRAKTGENVRKEKMPRCEIRFRNSMYIPTVRIRLRNLRSVGSNPRKGALHLGRSILMFASWPNLRWYSVWDK